MACGIDIPKEPNAGDDLTADWGRRVVRCLRALRIVGGANVRTETTSLGTVVSADAGRGRAAEARREATPLLPFAVRHYAGGDGKEAEWQVYLPKGCATLVQGQGFETRSYVADNADAAGGVGLGEGWRRLELAEGDCSVVRLGDRAARLWEVWASFMPWPSMTVSSSKRAGAFELLKVANVYEVEYAAGSEEGGGGEAAVERRVVQLRSGAVSVERDISSPFSVEYALDDYEARKPAVTPRIVNQHIRVGRLYKEVESPTEVPDGAKSAWVKVGHADETVTLSVAFDLEAADAESDDDKTVVKIYSFGDGAAVADDTRSLLSDLPFYTNAPAASSGSDGDDAEGEEA